MSHRLPPRSFRDLQVWRKSAGTGTRCFRFTESFPDREKFGLSHQMRHAAVSVPANIVEGFGKRGKADKARFLEECRYYLILTQDLGYGRTEQRMVLLEETSRLLNARAILASGS
jgi:four helix bundle protein